MSSVKADDVLDQILPAFDYQNSKWRTVGGVSRQVNLPPEIVNTTIKAHPEVFRKSWVSPAGIAVYGLKRHGIQVIHELDVVAVTMDLPSAPLRTAVAVDIDRLCQSL